MDDTMDYLKANVEAGEIDKQIDGLTTELKSLYEVLGRQYR